MKVIAEFPMGIVYDVDPTERPPSAPAWTCDTHGFAWVGHYAGCPACNEARALADMEFIARVAQAQREAEAFFAEEHGTEIATARVVDRRPWWRRLFGRRAP